MTKEIRHFLDISDFSGEELKQIIDAAGRIKQKLKSGTGKREKPLEGKVLAMIFDKPSTRTRVSFDVGMRQLGGETLLLSGSEMQLGRGETIADTAKVLSRMVDCIMIRTTNHERLVELSEHATVPVINGLTDDTHPCQIMADVMTLVEHCGPAEQQKIAWTGDGNNVLTSLIQGAARFGYELNIATPQERRPDEEILKWAAAENANIKLTTDPVAAVRGVDCVITDTWVSMGDDEAASGDNMFRPYQVNAQLMESAKPDAIFMHCLPAHRNHEVTDEVMDGPQSVVFDEAENRLHVQKGILAWCFDQLDIE